MLASKVPLDADKLIMLLTIELSGGEGSWMGLVVVGCARGMFGDSLISLLPRMFSLVDCCTILLNLLYTFPQTTPKFGTQYRSWS